MNSHLNIPPLLPYPIKIEIEHKVEVGTWSKHAPKKAGHLLSTKRHTSTK